MLIDPITGEESEPDEQLMRSIEEKVEVSESGKDSFRNEIFRKVAIAERRNESFDYTTHEKLKEALETPALRRAARHHQAHRLREKPRRGAAEGSTRSSTPSSTGKGTAAVCANELLKYVSSLLAREK